MNLSTTGNYNKKTRLIAQTGFIILLIYTYIILTSPERCCKHDDDVKMCCSYFILKTEQIYKKKLDQNIFCRIFALIIAGFKIDYKFLEGILKILVILEVQRTHLSI